MNDTFSKRHGYNLTEKEIEIREDAPQGLREFIIQSIYAYNYLPSFLWTKICRILRKSFCTRKLLVQNKNSFRRYQT